MRLPERGHHHNEFAVYTVPGRDTLKGTGLSDKSYCRLCRELVPNDIIPIPKDSSKNINVETEHTKAELYDVKFEFTS